MPKRGRPILNNTDDVAVLRRRQQTAARVRRLREQRSLARAAATQQQTPQQLEQAEAVTERPFEEIEAAQTMLSVGLRVQNVVLAQDAGDAQLQQEAIHIDEHSIIYHRDDATTYTPATPMAPTRPEQSNLARFFLTLPPENPFSTPLPAQSRPASPPAIPIIIQERDVDDNEAGSGHDTRGEELDATAASEIDEDSQSSQESSEKSSVYSFLSEHSAHPINVESDDVEISAHDHAVQKLYEQLQDGFHGCSLEQHEERLREHIEQSGDNHYGLNDIFNDPSFPSVLGLPDLISAERLARQHTPTPAQWRAMFCGIPPPQHEPYRQPMNVCLHKEETQAVEPQVAFDIDSFLGFASSLAMARQGLLYQPAPQMRQNMTTDVHLETSVFQNGGDPDQPSRSHLAMLKDVPHFLLGRVVGAHDITVHILFPHLATAGPKFTCLTKDQLSRWLDSIFHPAVYRQCEAHYTQHLPASYRHALAGSKARQVEGRLVETASYQSQQYLSYHLQPEYLDQIWTHILGTIADTPGLADFREPQLFFSAKGTKLQFKTSPSRPTMLDAMENFQSYLERVIDLDFVYLNRLYIDIGKEICPRISLLSSERQRVGDEAQVYHWKRCCLEHYIRWMYDGQPPVNGSNGQRYFEQNMLYEASCLNSVTPKRSKLREGGLIYSQFYCSINELSDAAKCKPFENDGLEELALDPQIRQGARNAAGGFRRDAKIVERAYCASKYRTRAALLDSRNKSFGVREEHRIDWSLFQGLVGQLQLKDSDELEIILADCPTYAWPIRSEVYLNYLWRSADKFAAGFEIIHARCRKELVTWEQTKMMAMFLRCLRFVFGGHLISRESALWWSRRERSAGQPAEQRIWYGLGFCNTLPRYKYCWLEPRVDWGQLTFLSDVTDHILFGNSMLRGQYLRRGGQVEDFFDATRQLDLALEWVEKYQANARIRERLLSWMVNICLQQFRRDILHGIKLEIKEEHREEAFQGRTPFCQEYLEEISINRVHLISGNRCDFKNVSDLGHFLFNFDDGQIRKHWEDRPYRKLYRRGRVGLDVRDSVLRLGSRFTKLLWRKLYAYHWVLPYPCAEVFTQVTKQGQRMWYSIQTDIEDVGRLQRVRPEEWRWARKGWREGFPSELPQYTEWNKEEWIEWLSEVDGGVRNG